MGGVEITTIRFVLYTIVKCLIMLNIILRLLTYKHQQKVSNLKVIGLSPRSLTFYFL